MGKHEQLVVAMLSVVLTFMTHLGTVLPKMTLTDATAVTQWRHHEGTQPSLSIPLAFPAIRLSTLVDPLPSYWLVGKPFAKHLPELMQTQYSEPLSAQVRQCEASNAASADLYVGLPPQALTADIVKHFNDLQPDPLYSRSLISATPHDLRDVNPIYVLAFTFNLPSYRTIQASIKVLHDWTLDAVSSPARISGWKTSNLQYRFSQQAA